MKRKAIIIGSGIAGLAVSIRLISKGFDVEVYEKNDSVGGKLSDFYIDDFRHDFGPKLFTMPDLIEDLYRIAGVNIDDYFKYEKLEIACKYFWDDGDTLNAYSNNQKFINEVYKKFNKEENKVNDRCGYVNRMKTYQGKYMKYLLVIENEVKVCESNESKIHKILKKINLECLHYLVEKLGYSS